MAKLQYSLGATSIDDVIKRQAKYREYWAQVSDRVRQKYGISLQQYIENGIEENKPVTYLALQLGVNHQTLHDLIKRSGIKRKPKQKPKPIKKELTNIMDIVDLELKDISCLTYRKQTDWISIENKIKQKYKAPSLPAYLLYEHQFNGKSIVDLSSELGVRFGILRDTMCELGIPLKNYQGRKKRNYESDYNYLMKRYWQDDGSIGKIGKEQGITRQAVHQKMKRLGIPRRKMPEAQKVRRAKENYFKTR